MILVSSKVLSKNIYDDFGMKDVAGLYKVAVQNTTTDPRLSTV